ncbi:hydrogenase iron-sulfur subunit [Halegenticoccus tardaugens]|uniref:hydrogenase iron-sulfur subunit n=1 Tax=Halegenticoccus tardaugens TaxID=2071624 RepID=UPI00100B534D|nr:hydrogenase iron-sulfur subunit [Halegenticoccus tardaugens]
MNVGAFVCSCADTCDVDLAAARDGVEGVDVAANSGLLCGDGLDAMGAVVDEHELDELIVTCPDEGVQGTFRELAEEKGLHPDAVAFVDQREGAGWVHDRDAATDKTARLVNAAAAGMREEAVSRTVRREAGCGVAVVGDPETAAVLSDAADVTLVADGAELAGVDGLDDVTIERGRAVSVDGRFGEFTVTVASRVTDDCISCMKCVREGPDGMVTRRPVDIDPDAPEGAWTDCCPTDAIEMGGARREIEVDQVVHPGADRSTRGGRLGLYTGPVDGATVAAIESLLGGVEGPDFLDLDMDVCAAGSSGQTGCTACVDACPHGAVERPRVDAVEFYKEACRNCGACTSVCPTGATRLREPSNRRLAREVEALLRPTREDGGGWLFGRNAREGGVETPVVAFVCSERADDALREYGRLAAADEFDVSYPPILPVAVNCADTVGEAHALHALAAGADGVLLVGCGCDCRHSGADPKAALCERLNRATADLGLGERVAFLAPEPDDPGAFVDAVGGFVDGLDPTPVPPGDHEAAGGAADEGEKPAFSTHDWALESVRAIAERVEPDRRVIRGLESFGRIEVTDDCTLTPTCSTLCPTDAIRRVDGDLEFNHERCVNCGLCEDGCVEGAIELDGGLHLDLLPENRGGDGWTRVVEGEMLACRRCGEPFTSERSARKIQEEVGHLVGDVAPGAEGSVFEYCGNCRAARLYDRGGS